MDWITCPGCGLKHSPRPDGLCPRCRTQIGAAAPQPPLPPNRAFERPRFDKPASPSAGEPLPTQPWGGEPAPLPTTPIGPSSSEVSAGSLVSRTLSVWWANVGRFALLLLAAFTPLAVLGGVAAFPVIRAARVGEREAFRSLLPLFLLFFAAAWIVGMVYQGSVTVGVLDHLAGKRVRVGSSIKAALRRAFPLALLGVAIGVAATIGLLLFIVPGIFLLVALSLTLPVLMAESSTGVGAAFSRSFALTKGKRWSLFAAFLVIMVIGWLVGAVSNLIPPLAAALPILAVIVGLVSLVVQVAIAPMGMILCAVAYHDLRVAKEGVDTSQLARIFE